MPSPSTLPRNEQPSNLRESTPTGKELSSLANPSSSTTIYRMAYVAIVVQLILFSTGHSLALLLSSYVPATRKPCKLGPMPLSARSDCSHPTTHTSLPSLISSFNSRNTPYTTTILGNLFSDGACTVPSIPSTKLAAWAVTSATHGQCIAAGPLAGWPQSINRAELTAAIVALQWTLRSHTTTTLWTDSAYVARGFWKIQSDPLSTATTNPDLWHSAAQLLTNTPPHQFQVLHITSHSVTDDDANVADEWTAHWNDQADLCAELTP